MTRDGGPRAAESWADPSPLGETTIQSLPPFIPSSHLYVLGILYRPSRRFFFHSVSIISIFTPISENKQVPKPTPTYFFSISGQTVAPPTKTSPVASPAYSHEESSPIAKKSCPSQLILNPSTMDSAFSTVGSALGILHGISGTLFHI